MKRHLNDIDQFTHQVQRRLNRHLGWHLLIRWLTLAGGVLVTVAAVYLWRGVQVPLFWYPLVLGIVLVSSGLHWLVCRHSQGQAARFVDHHFRLQDAVRSYLGFHRSHHDQGFYALQAQQTAGILQDKSPHHIPFSWPKHWLAIGLVLLAGSVLMGSKGDSLQVRQERQRAVLLLEQTGAIKNQLQESTEEVLTELSDMNLPADVNLKSLRQWVDLLTPTGDLEEAHRQVAHLEQQLNQLQASLQQRHDEQLLDRIGRDLLEAKSTQNLGSMLTQRKYRQSARELEQFQVNPKASESRQQQQGQQLQQLAALMSQQNQQQSSKPASSSKLGQTINQLQQTTGQMSKAQQQRQQQNNESTCLACQQATQQANQSLGEMSRQLQRMGTRRQVQQSLQKLSQQLSQCQSQLGQPKPGQGQGSQSSQGNGPGQGEQPGQDGAGIGGKEAGTGAGQLRSAHPDDPEGGTLQQLNGLQGQGPGDVTTEEATSGAGSRGTARTDQERLFQHQAESFIQREDVPSAVKAGVKTYFENIHQREEPNHP